ncbi:MAG: hypothetical protein R3F59_34625 [Myxococcota bacterium]
MRFGRFGALALLVGCGSGNSVRGDVDGDPVPLRSGYFAQDDNFFDGGDGIIYVRLTDIEDACAADTQWNADIEDADDTSDLEDFWQDDLPEDFWVIDLYLRVGDPDDDLSGKILDGVAWDEVTEKDDQIYGQITHYTSYLDQEYWDALLGGPGVDPDDYYGVWYTDGGDLEPASTSGPSR